MTITVVVPLPIVLIPFQNFDLYARGLSLNDYEPIVENGLGLNNYERSTFHTRFQIEISV